MGKKTLIAGGILIALGILAIILGLVAFYEPTWFNVTDPSKTNWWAYGSWIAGGVVLLIGIVVLVLGFHDRSALSASLHFLLCHISCDQQALLPI